MNENTQNTSPQSGAGQVSVLMKKYSTDPTFRAEFDAAGSPEECVLVATRHGIAVCIQDMIALGEAGNELSDDILDRVSGGFNFTFN